MSNFIDSAKSSLKWVALAGGTILGYKLLKKRFHKQKNEQDSQSIFDNEMLLCHLKLIIKHFTGCLNPLTSITNEFDKDSASVAFENIYQIIDGHGDDDLHRWMNSFFVNRSAWTEEDYKAKAGIILNLLTSCGITPVQENTVVWSEELKEKYNRLMAIEDGHKCKVVAPYWMYEGTIYEKGIVIKS